MEHTKEPWEVRKTEVWDVPSSWAVIIIRPLSSKSPEDEIVAWYLTDRDTFNKKLVQAERIVIEHNACAGLTNEEVERTVPYLPDLIGITDIALSTFQENNLLPETSKVIRKLLDRIEGKETA